MGAASTAGNTDGTPAASGAPNTAPLPNPWAGGGASGGPPAGLGGLAGLAGGLGGMQGLSGWLANSATIPHFDGNLISSDHVLLVCWFATCIGTGFDRLCSENPLQQIVWLNR